MDYRIEDFTLANYRRLLCFARDRLPFHVYDDVLLDSSRFVVWRHDIDFCVESAVKLARIEEEEGVSAVYFIQLTSPFYNPCDYLTRRSLLEIADRGHELALHFDPMFHNPKNEVELERSVKTQSGWFAELFGCQARTFSVHNPTEATLKWNRWRYAGLINTYAQFFLDDVEYCSDSNGYWRHRPLSDVLIKESVNRLQVLTHPVWWRERPLPPMDRVHQTIDATAQRLKDDYDDALRLMGRTNVSAADVA